MAQFCCRYILTLSNINRFSKLFHCQNKEKICNNTIIDDPSTPKVCCYTIPCKMSPSGKNCHSISLITPLVSGVTGLSASSSSKVDTLNNAINSGDDRLTSLVRFRSVTPEFTRRKFYLWRARFGENSNKLNQRKAKLFAKNTCCSKAKY